MRTPSISTVEGLPTKVMLSCLNMSCTSIDSAGWGSACRTASWLPGAMTMRMCFGTIPRYSAAFRYWSYTSLIVSSFSWPG
ncbi:MAG: hypothetical protein A4E28_01029 [Methanocella sp. PtaU1.Bin125]|nr:MAG: hypothetical protein A4E28_01029 [Methanocella sp. PtaU1.Bin125]